MIQFSKMALIATVAGLSVSAAAGTIDLNYTGIVGGTSAGHARVNATTYYAGHMNHTITSGSRTGESFNTFCIELGEFAANGSATYDIIDLADAPDPGAYYGQARADAVSAIVANAYAMGWIDSQLQATDPGASDYLAKMGAIQAAIWEALGSTFDVNSSSTTAAVRTQYNALTNISSFDGNRRMIGLRAAVAAGQQDMLFIVPLPTGALAGLTLLGGIAGVRTVRRRR